MMDKEVLQEAADKVAAFLRENDAGHALTGQFALVRYQAEIALRAADKNLDELLNTVAFYADPETYFAIAFMADPPCGEFAEDFEDLEGDLGHPDGSPWTKPGKRARACLRQVFPEVFS